MQYLRLLRHTCYSETREHCTGYSEREEFIKITGFVDSFRAAFSRDKILSCLRLYYLIAFLFMCVWLFVCAQDLNFK